MRTVWAAVAMLLVLAGETSADDAVTGEAQVRDAVTIALAGARFRLDGLTAPDVQSCGGRPCADAAAEALGAKLAGREVTCIRQRRFGHGHYLARCKSDDGSDLAEFLLEQGLALPEPSAQPGYQEAAERAKSERRGLWSR